MIISLRSVLRTLVVCLVLSFANQATAQVPLAYYDFEDNNNRNTTVETTLQESVSTIGSPSVSGISLTQNICTVCQDAMHSPEVCRRLRPCQHSFHRGCIDEWFRRSVFCPSCRHDIRNPTPSPRLGAVAQPAIIPQENVL
jgi:hypothetical protein